MTRPDWPRGAWQKLDWDDRLVATFWLSGPPDYATWRLDPGGWTRLPDDAQVTRNIMGGATEYAPFDPADLPPGAPPVPG